MHRDAPGLTRVVAAKASEAEKADSYTSPYKLAITYIMIDEYINNEIPQNETRPRKLILIQVRTNSL